MTLNKELIARKSTCARCSRPLWTGFGLTGIISISILIVQIYINVNLSKRIEHVEITRSRGATMIIQYRAPYIGPKTTRPKSYQDPVLNGNWGDWLWKYAANGLLDENKTLICKTSRDICIEENEWASIVHYHPFANDLPVYRDSPYKHLVAQMDAASTIIRQYRDTFLTIGLGTQGEFSNTSAKRDLGMALSIETAPEDIVLGQSALRFLSELQRKKQVAFFRGAFTNKVSQNNGYFYGLETGCPTLMINEDIKLGQTLQSKYEKLATRVGDRSLKIALNSSPRHRRVRELIGSIMNLYPNSVLFVQERSESKQFEEYGIPFNRLRIFEGDIASWLKAISDMDMAFGPRIHGNMAALSASPPVPAFVLAPDHRVLELAKTMRLPYTDIYDRRLLRKKIDVVELVRDFHFDGNAFDINRCGIAKLYTKEFRKVGLHISERVQSIANQC